MNARLGRGRCARWVNWSIGVGAAVLSAGVGLFVTDGGEAGEPDRVEFLRMHVPADRLDHVPLGNDRRIPLTVAEFDALVARASAQADGSGPQRPTPLAARVHVSARLDEREGLVGTVRCTVGGASAGVSPALPLGGLVPRAATRSTADAAGSSPADAVGSDSGEGLVFGGDSGGLFLATPTAGTFTFDFVCPPDGGAGSRYRLSLVPALETRIDLQLPPDLRPVLFGSAAREAVLGPAAGTAGGWQIDVGPAALVGIELVGRERPVVSLRTWSEVVIRHRGAGNSVAVVPDPGWQAGDVTLEKSPTLVIAGIEADEEPVGRGVTEDRALGWREAPGGREVVITVPARLEGTRTPLVIRGVAPAADDVWRLPLVRPLGPSWGGGGLIVRLDPALVATAVELTECQVVAPQAASSWPLPQTTSTRPSPRSAVFHLEQQAPTAAVELTVRPRNPTFDVARVTTVEISPAAVLGRAACDVQVVDGEAFELLARIAPGWIIDSVEPVTLADEGSRRAILGDELLLEWRTIRGPDGNLLRIGLPVALTPADVLGLRISGHRPRIPVGTPFAAAEIDMVRLPGESADAALVDFKVGPEAVVEVDGEPAGWLRARGRLAPLVEEGTLRARILGSDQASNREVRVIQRRPPLDADVEVRLDVRDELLVQSFTFSCEPRGGGIDTLVAHFSEPMGEPLDWSVLAPADVALVVRRLETPGGLAGGLRNDAIAESWLIECTPAVSGPLSIRAVRTLPFVGAVPVPLAWLDGDTTPGGVVELTASGPRPEIVSRRLRELPGGTDGGSWPGVRGEFVYGPPAVAGDGLSAAELIPAAAPADARAWAWIERVSCWCDESGTVETESRFEIENHGRSFLTLSVTAGRVLERVLVDGSPVTIDTAEPADGAQRIPLPPASRRIELLVRTRAASDPASGFWRVDPLGCGIDVPVLDRDIRLLVPPGLDVAASAGAYREVGRLESGWLRRLIGPPWAKTSEAYAARPDSEHEAPPTAAALQTGFHARRFVVASDRAAGSGIVVIRRRLLGSLVILAAAIAAAVTFRCQPRRPRVAVGICIAAAMAALWAAAPFDVVARVAVWAAVGGALAAATGPLVGRLTRRLVRLARLPARGWAGVWLVPLAAVVSPEMTVANAGEPWRVVITAAAEEPLALVPEPLFRMLADAVPPDATGVRVIGCRVEVPEPASGGSWTMRLDIDADVGGGLILEQSAERGVWRSQAPGDVPAGVRLLVDGSRLRLSTSAAGRFTVALRVEPEIVREGGITIAALDVPVAPAATLVVVDPSGSPVDPRQMEIQCDRGGADGPWQGAPRLSQTGAGPGFDIAGARRVRVVRPADSGMRLATRMLRSDNFNEVTWGLDACRVEAAFAIDGGADIVRSFVVRADERFTSVEALPVDGGMPRLTRLADDRLFVELPTPAAGLTRVRMLGTLPLADPVGSFTMPFLWPEVAAAAECAVRLTTAPELEAVIDPPLVAAASGPLPQRLTVRRRPQQPRGSQSLLVDVAADRTLLRLRTQIDAATLPLVQLPVDVPAGSLVDRIALVRDDSTTTAGESSVDISWTRTAADSVAVVVQQPRPGRFRLDVDVRLPTPLPAEGRLPLARARLRGGAPLLVTWQTTPGLRLTVTPAAAGADAVPQGTAIRSTELLEGDAAPDYSRQEAGALQDAGGEPATTDPTATAAVAPRAVVTEDRLERTEVLASLDGRGRVRGIVRFDLLVDEPVVRVRLPAGMRLFDVLVDGRDTPAVPRDAGTWDVRLQDVDWPRSLVAMFSGDLGPGFAAGEPVRLEPPAIDGLAGGSVWWTIDPPAGSALGIAEPARPLGEDDVEAERAAIRQRLDAIFDLCIAGSTAVERGRLESLATVRRVGASLPAEAAWEEAVRGLAQGRRTAGTPPEVFESRAADGGLTLRVSRDVDSTAAGRTLATAVLLCAGAGLWFAGRRGNPGG